MRRMIHVAIVFITVHVLALATTQQQIGPQAAFSPARRQSQPQSNSSKKSAMPMPLVAPLFIAGTNTLSTLTLVHGLDTAITVDIRVVDLSGETVADFRQAVPPHVQTAVDMNDQLQKRGIGQSVVGSLSVTPEGVTVQLGAQLSLVRNTGQENDIEEELVMLNDSVPNVFRSVATAVTGAPIIAIANVAAKPQNVSLSCLEQGRRAVVKVFEIPGSHTVLIKSCSQSVLPENAMDLASLQSDLGHALETVGVSVESDGAAGTLAVFGVAPRDLMVYEAMPFIQTGTLRSNGSTYPGVPVGVTQLVGFRQFVPELGVANFGSKPANIKVLYMSAALSSGTPQEIASVSVSPLTSIAIPIPDLAGDPNMQNSFLVQTDAEKGQVISSLYARSTDGEQIVDLPNQDQKKPANGGQHPWVVDKSTASYLLLYNADTSSSRNVAVTLYTGTKGGHVSKTVQVEPAHTIALSVQDLLTGTNGAKDSDTATNPDPAQVQSQQGIITWLSLDASTMFGRMLQVNSVQRWNRNFSCQVEYIACAATAFPNTTLAKGESNTLYGYANVCPSSGACTCDGSESCSYQTAPASSYYWWVDDTSIASLSGSVYDSSVTVVGNNSGQTNVELGVTDTSDYQCSGSTQWGYGQPAQITVLPNPCFAQLKYRPVIEGGINWGNHSFWWYQKSTAEHYVTDAGPTGNCFPDCGYLNNWVVFGDTGNYPEDNPNASLDWDSGTYGYVCQGVTGLDNYAWAWPENNTRYCLGCAPNSNTYAHSDGNAAGFYPPQPPNTPGW